MKEKIKTSEHSKEEKDAFLEKLNELSLKWENTSGIEEVLNKHIVDENKFIVFCENKDHLEQMEQLVASWFEKALKKPIEIYKIVYGNKENTRNLNTFINGKNKQHVYLLLSIDMLNEGMHIQDVDGVVLLRKTTSISFVSAITFSSFFSSFSSSAIVTPTTKPAVRQLINKSFFICISLPFTLSIVAYIIAFIPF